MDEKELKRQKKTWFLMVGGRNVYRFGGIHSVDMQPYMWPFHLFVRLRYPQIWEKKNQPICQIEMLAFDIVKDCWGGGGGGIIILKHCWTLKNYAKITISYALVFTGVTQGFSIFISWITFPAAL